MTQPDVVGDTGRQVMAECLLIHFLLTRMEEGMRRQGMTRRQVEDATLIALEYFSGEPYFTGNVAVYIRSRRQEGAEGLTF